MFLLSNLFFFTEKVFFGLLTEDLDLLGVPFLTEFASKPFDLTGAQPSDSPAAASHTRSLGLEGSKADHDEDPQLFSRRAADGLEQAD